jgi:hypothetical protein
MSDPTLRVDVDGHPVDLDAAVSEPGRETWLVRSSPPRWQVWRDHNRRRPLSRAEKRGRVAAATAGTVFGVMGVGGLISYAIEWQGLLNEATDQVWSTNPAQVVSSEGLSTSDMQLAIDRAQSTNSGSSGLIGIVNGQVAAITPDVGRAAADQGFVKEAVKQAEGNRGYPDTHMSGASVCVYWDTSITWNGLPAVVVNVVDLTPDRDRLNGAYLRYGLGSLAGAGAAAGAVWWGLGRRRNSIGEPDEV